MKTKSGRFTRMIVVAAILMAVTVIFYGCSSAESAKMNTTADQSVYQSPEQTTCPVTGGPINKHIYTVYKGKKVYFCCEGCKDAFEKNPERYMDKLPQFAK